MLTYLWIAIGGALGSVARYGVAGVIAERIGDPFPWGTLVVNVTGSFVIGFFAVLTGPEGRVPATTDMRLFVMTGICGGYTTFSAFSLQTLELLRSGDIGRGVGNVALSVTACLLAVWIGALAAGAVNRLKGA